MSMENKCIMLEVLFNLKHKYFATQWDYCVWILAMLFIYGSRPPSAQLFNEEWVAQTSFLKAVSYLALPMCGHLCLHKQNNELHPLFGQ